MEEAITRFKEIILNVEADIAEAEDFKKDLIEKYTNAKLSLDDLIRIQSMVLKISDYVSQKRITKAELERQLLDYEKALKGE